MQPSFSEIRTVGENSQVPLLNGEWRRYINFDNAASTPVMQPVWDGISRFMGLYSSIHRGAGFKSQVSTWAYEKSREILCNFLGADPSERVVIYGKHTTDAINKLSHRFPFEKGNVVITTLMEHHSNDLPWRDKAQVVRIYSDEKSPINPQLLQDALEKSQGRCKLVVVTGASNVTGLINPIYDLAKIAHQYGAQILVDAAQLAPHRKIIMGKRGEEQSIDYLALSGHKMYAPFGSGALIGWPEIFEQGEPEYKGGGAVKFVSRDEIVWKEPPEKEEAGSPNVVGVVALAMAAKNLQAFGMDRVAAHEAKLAYKLVEGMQGIPGIEFIGPETYNPEVRVGVIAFNVKGLHHAKTAAILSCEFGIAVRNGCFCAQPYLKQLLHFTDEQSEWLKNKIKNDEEVELPGAVRASFGVYNTLEEVDVFLEALKKIARGDYQGTYVPDPERGDYWPKEFKPDYQEFFNF